MKAIAILFMEVNISKNPIFENTGPLSSYLMGKYRPYGGFITDGMLAMIGLVPTEVKFALTWTFPITYFLY